MAKPRPSSTLPLHSSAGSTDIAITTLDIDDIRIVEGWNMRSAISAESVTQMADEIRAGGLLHPITVRPNGSHDAPRYDVVAGHRRYLAAHVLRRPTIAAVIRDTDETTALLDSTAENFARSDVSSYDRARRYADLAARGVPVKIMAARFGVSESAVRNLVRVWHKLGGGPDTTHPDGLALRQAWAGGKIGTFACLEVMGLPVEEQLRRIRRVMQLERAATDALQTGPSDGPARGETPAGYKRPSRPMCAWAVNEIQRGNAFRELSEETRELIATVIAWAAGDGPPPKGIDLERYGQSAPQRAERRRTPRSQ